MKRFLLAFAAFVGLAAPAMAQDPTQRLLIDRLYQTQMQHGQELQAIYNYIHGGGYSPASNAVGYYQPPAFSPPYQPIQPLAFPPRPTYQPSYAQPQYYNVGYSPAYQPMYQQPTYQQPLSGTYGPMTYQGGIQPDGNLYLTGYFEGQPYTLHLTQYGMSGTFNGQPFNRPVYGW